MIEVLYVFHYSKDKQTKAYNRLCASIDSLRNQDVKIIVVNYSDLNIPEYHNIFTHHKINYTGVFNKPLLINYAVKNYIKGKYFLFSDVDLIYQNDYIERMKDYTHDLFYRRVVPYNYNIYQEMYSNNYTELMGLSKSSGGFGHGNGLIHTESFMNIHGLDEFYVGYAPEDDDINKRLKVSGNELIYDKEIQTCHLWHEPLNRIQHEKNMEYYTKRMAELNESNMIVNGKKWGEL